jgi:hypothetical protein
MGVLLYNHCHWNNILDLKNEGVDRNLTLYKPPPNTLEKVAEGFSDPASTSAPSNGNPTGMNHHPSAHHAGWIVSEQAFVIVLHDLIWLS